MALRFALPKRFPINAALAGKRTPASFRYNSTASPAGTIAQLAAAAEKPSPLEASVPVMWAICGGLIYAAWNRIDERETESVEKLLIV
ncbi:hypothetical protein EJ04DRAFT_559132 [Polyplosphaeria fusca]|uniref:Uncharacterized protein n=1 Tax=Polyplosphaeria fusca TaxID=682080 RepID=A0A9P4RBQ1_9PLEO|nr:hypothetical protein EJ04DRAFT_559132 [Polyplosphaeria fusca]